MKKRVVVLILALTMIFALAAACGDSGTKTEAKEKKEITVALYMLANSMEPLSEDLAALKSIVYHVYDRLVNFKPDTIEWFPGIAKSWRQVDDRTIEFEINMDYKFSNGDPITMEDIIFSLNYLKEVPKHATTGNLIESLTYDGNLLTFRGVSADNTLHHKVLATAVIFNKKYIETGGDEALYSKPIGTGPYVVTEFTPGATCTLSTWDAYPFAKPDIDIINYILIFETTPRYIALENGEIQFTHNLNPSEIELANANPNLSTLLGTSYLIQCLLFNNERPPFDNVNVRRALTHAFDRDGFNSLQGGRINARSLLFLGADDFVTISPNYPTYDLDKAKEMLAAEGYDASNPLSFTLTCNTDNDPGLEMYQSALRQIGVEMLFNIVEFSVWIATEQSGDFEMGYTPQPNMGNHPLTDVDRWDVNLMGVRNTTRYFNPAAQAIVDQFRFIPTSDARLKQLGKELTDIVSYDVPMIPIFIMEERCAMDSRLTGVIANNRIIDFREARWAD